MNIKIRINNVEFRNNCNTNPSIDSLWDTVQEYSAKGDWEKRWGKCNLPTSYMRNM